MDPDISKECTYTSPSPVTGGHNNSDEQYTTYDAAGHVLHLFTVKGSTIFQEHDMKSQAAMPNQDLIIKYKNVLATLAAFTWRVSEK